MYKNRLSFKDYTMDMYLLESEEGSNIKEYIMKRGNQNFTYCHIIKRKTDGTKYNIN